MQKPRAAPPVVSPPSVLLVNDTEDEREMYVISLELSGYRTLQARNASDACRIATEFTPNVVITDVVLSGSEDGFGLTRLLKADDRTKNVRVVILTGRVFEHDRLAAAGAGCDLFLTKPCLPDVLAVEISRLLAPSRRLPVRHARRAAKARLKSRAPIDRARARANDARVSGKSRKS